MPPKKIATLAKNLKAVRDAAGLSQQELAVRAGLSVSVVFQMEQGRKRDALLSTLICLAEGLEMKPGELVDALLRDRETRRGKGK